MTVKEILDRITKEDIERAIASFDTNPYERKVNDEYTLVHQGKYYPCRELIMRASNRELEKAENKKSYTTVIAKNKLKREGFKTFSNNNKMFKYYLKKASKQDKTRTTVINTEAISSFFDVNIQNDNDEDFIMLKYLSDNSIVRTKLIKHQDPRIFIDRDKFEEGNILLFTKEDNSQITLKVFNSYDNEYNAYESNLKNNFLLTDNLPLENLNDILNDPKSEYNNDQMKQPLNQILYGPPGTGKTDSTVEKALEILELKTGDRETDRETFRSLLNKKIFFVTMHPSYSYEDFVQGIKPKTSVNGDLLFEPKSGIFKIVSDLAKTVYEEDGEITDNEIDNNDILRISFFLSKFNSKTDKKANVYFGDKSNGKVFAKVGNQFGHNPNSIKNHRDKFDFLTTTDRKGWKPNNGSSNTLDNTPLWPYNDIYLELKDKTFDEVKKIVKDIENKTKTTTTKTEQNINYVLILDEINRANISKVFGELITLLEEDKRIGNENELSVTLPSGEIFAVPSNLYIIGTMNTADKSIALVDIALRRRFQFIPVYPDSGVIDLHCKSNDKDEKKAFMINVNTLLRKERGVDFQIGHAYFLKDNSLADVINENIIPLLTEYFRNDLDKVRKHMKDIGNGLDEDYFTETGLLKYTK